MCAELASASERRYPPTLMSTETSVTVTPPPRAGRLRGLAANLLLSVVSVAVVLGGMEIVLRFAGFQTRGTWSAPCYQRVDDIGHLFVPGYQGSMYKGISSGWSDIPVRINAHGLRGPEFPLAKPPGVQRVLVLGDSCTFGYLLPEEDAYTSQLQHLLDERRGAGKVHVINAGVPGYGINNEAEFLEHRGLAFDPDAIVVTASSGDIPDAGVRKNPDIDGESVDMSRELRLYRFVRMSALMNFLQYLFFKVVVWSDPKMSLDHGLSATNPSPAVQEALRRYEQDFARVTELARAHGVPLLLLVYPGQLELFSDRTVVRDRWRALAEKYGVVFVDLLPSFKAERLQKLYLPADGHPTAEGNRLVAEAVAGTLARVLPAAQSSS